MTAEKLPFATGDLVVYPTHGVGKITAIETQEIAGHTLSVFVVTFDKDRMTLRVPLAKAKVSGLRKLSSRKEMDAALAKLRGRSRAKRTMWSRRAQEYQAKIASGDPGLDRRGGARPVPQRRAARAVLQRAPDLSGGARPAGARVCRGRADRRDHRDTARRAAAVGLTGSAEANSRAGARGVNGGAERKSGPAAARAGRIWAIAAVHGEAERLPGCTTGSPQRFERRRPDRLSRQLSRPRRRGRRDRSTRCSISAGASSRAAAALPATSCILRGAQEEMWQKLLQLQFAGNPGEVLGLDGARGRRGDRARLWRRAAARFRGDARRAR